LLGERGIFTKEEFWEMVGVVNGEMKRKNGILFLVSSFAMQYFKRKSLRNTFHHC